MIIIAINSLTKKMSKVAEPVSWADIDDLPANEVIENNDGTKTIISYKRNDKNQKIKIIQKIKEVKITEKVDPLVALRRKWKRYGEEKNNTKEGPDPKTTYLDEAITLRFKEKSLKKENAAKEAEPVKKSVTSTISCRLCGGPHFSSKCPYKETLGGSSALSKDGESAVASPGSAAAIAAAAALDNPRTYISPIQRRKMEAEANGLSLPSGDNKFERDDSCTLRVMQLNEVVDNNMIRDELFRQYDVVKVNVVRNKLTGVSKGIAYVTFINQQQAQNALERFNGRGYMSLILNIEWSKPRPPQN